MINHLLQKRISAVFFILVILVSIDSVSSIAVESRKMKIVSNMKDLKAAVHNLHAGDKILIEPGIYNGGFAAQGLEGTKKEPIVIAGKDPKNPPVFKGTGRGEAVKMSSVAYIKLKNLTLTDFPGNGINIDDGGNYENLSHHIIIENIIIKNIGPKGNNDAIKMSGVDDFIIKDCQIKGWGGSGIDLVGCHDGIIQTCMFQGTQGYRTKNGIQIKGGSRQILVQESAFINSGERVVHIGGNTGAAYFRPKNVDYEAKNIIVAGNRFVGGIAQVAWITALNSHVHHNIFYLPEKFVGRILQETKSKRFKPCQKGLFEANLVVTDPRLRAFFNIGIGTLPETFTFLHNAWYCFDSQDNKPQLPTREIDGIYGIYPDLENFGTPEMKITSKMPEMKDIGPRAFIPWHVETDFGDIKIPVLKEIAPMVSKGVSMQLLIICSFIAAGFILMVVRFVKNKK